jgi:AsmA-like C-terminal region
LHDSLWRQHQHELFRARQVYIELGFFKLLGGHLSIDKLTIEKGAAYLFSDSTGYSNMDILRKQTPRGKSSSFNLPDIEINECSLVIEKQEKNKLFSFTIDRLKCMVKNQDPSLLLDLNMSVMVHTLAFNRAKGGFVENKNVSGEFQLQLNPVTKILRFEKIGLQIDHQPFVLTGKFFLNIAPVPFTLSVQTNHIPFRQAASLVAQNIRKKLDQFSLGEISGITANFDGTDPDNPEPLIRIKMLVQHNDLATPIVSFDKTSFAAYFTNEWKPGLGRGDENSLLRFTAFSGTWENISLKSDTISFYNLLHPFLSCDIHSDFNLVSLNDLYDSKDLQFTKGSGKLNLQYKGPLDERDTSQVNKSLLGNLGLDSVSILYQPRNFLLSGCTGKINFVNKDLFIEQLTAFAGSSELNMSGAIRNAISLLGQNQQKSSFECSIVSPKLNLDDFTAFLKKKSSLPLAKKRKSMTVKTISEIIDALNDDDILLQLKAKQLIYKKFYATNLSAALLLQGNEITLQQVALNHGGGSLALEGSLEDAESDNPINIHVKMSKVDINKVFTAFNNFGQQAILDKNLKGKLDADIRLSGLITDKAAAISNSLKGFIDFSISNGELIAFEPVEKISEFAFKNRDFSDIHFAVLKDKLDLNGSEIKVNRMEIHSTVLTMFVEGTYVIGKGTDMSLQIPLSNIKDPKPETGLKNKGVSSKTGISVHLRAKTGPDGKLIISWDPFKKALKKTKKDKK